MVSCTAAEISTEKPVVILKSEIKNKRFLYKILLQFFRLNKIFIHEYFWRQMTSSISFPAIFENEGARVGSIVVSIGGLKQTFLSAIVIKFIKIMS